MKYKERVLVAMSGGIDSSLAAVLLKEQGYEVIGMTLKTWDYASSASSKKETGCCNLDTINDARTLAVDYDFPHYVLDIRKEFGDFVIDNFKQEYLSGRTPNPCVLCNTYIKWTALLERADQLDCQYIATGHYARIREENNRFFVSKGKDLSKDQSYALWGVSQKNLARTLLPLGGYLKSEIRQIAMKKGLKELVNKPESYEICFVPDNDYRGFLKKQIPDLEKKVSGGDFVLSNGEIVGKHQGYPFYTIGQRKGLVALGYPAYVIQIKKDENEVVLGDFDELKRNGMYVNQINLMKYAQLNERTEAVTKIRYNDAGTNSVIEQVGDTIKVFFGDGVNAIAPGQAAVFYDGDDVLGGGWIVSSFNSNTNTNFQLINSQITS